LGDWNEGNPLPIMASDHPETPTTLIVLEPALLYGRALDRIWIRACPADGARPADSLRDLLAGLASVRDVVNISVQHELLAAFFYAESAALRASSNLPEGLSEFLPPIITPNWHLASPDLELPDLFDARRIPEAIWSANLFGPTQVAGLGKENLLRADWVHAETLTSGGVLALATHEPPHHMSEEIGERVSRIIGQLRLSPLQKAARAAGNSKP
jgi:hypothetical protein